MRNLECGSLSLLFRFSDGSLIFLMLIPRTHANQLSHSGAIDIAAKNNALTVDHLEHLNDQEIETIRKSGMIATALPGCSFFMSAPYPPVRKMIDRDVIVNIASDCNPGTNPSGDIGSFHLVAFYRCEFQQ